MITSNSIQNLLDAIMPASHTHRTWIGKIPKKFQLNYLGCDFGSCTLMVCEKENTICELRKVRHGYIKYQGVTYEIKAKFYSRAPMLSKYDRASPLAKTAITNLMREHRASMN